MENLKFGDQIIFFGQQNDSKESTRGALSATGFSNNEIYLEKVDPQIFQKESYGASQVRNYRDFIFQVWPKLDFEAHKEFKRQRKQAIQFEAELNNMKEEMEVEPSIIQKQEEYYQDLKQKLNSLEQRKDNEKKHNFKQIKHVQGKYITYGTEIFLQHVDSQMFIQGTVLASASDKSAYQFELSDEFCKGMTFVILPRFKLRQEGEIIQQNDQILLHNVKVNGLTNFSTRKLAEIDNNVPQDKQNKEQYLGNRQLQSKKEDNRLRYECYLSNTVESSWQILKFKQAEDLIEEEKIIRGGDLIIFSHTEQEGELTADYQYKTEHQEAYIRQYEGVYDQEKNDIASVWEIETDFTESRGQEINVVQNIKSFQFETNLEKKTFKLRHILTGKLLTIKQASIDNKSLHIPCLTKDDKDYDQSVTDFVFIGTSGEETQRMFSQNSYLIMADKDKALHLQEEIRYKLKENTKQQKTTSLSDSARSKAITSIQGSPKSGADEIVEKQQAASRFSLKKPTFTNFLEISDDKIYEEFKDEEYELKRIGVNAKQVDNISEEHSFRIIKISPEEKQDILFIQSTIPIFQQALQKFKAAIPLPKELLKLVVKSMQDLIFFLVKTESDDPITCEGITNQSRQKKVKDFKLIEVFMDILYYPFKSGLYQLNGLNVIDPEILKMFKMTYRLIKHTIQEYRPNELYSSQWVNLLIRQSMLTDKGSDIGAEETLTELIDNNRKILETKINRRTIDYFMQMLLDDREDKYVKLLRALTICDGEAMVLNQGVISEILLENPQSSNRLVFQLKGNPKNVQVRSMLEDTEEFIPLEFLHRKKLKKKYMVEFNFFIEMTILLSELCQERNYKAIQPLEKLYPQEMCYKIIQDDNYDDGIRMAFTKLCITLWVDKFPYTKIILPEKIRVWNDIEKKKKEILSSTEDLNQILPLKQFVFSFLEKQSKEQFQNSTQQSHNQFIFSVLQLTKKMIEFGFYQNQDELNDLLKTLLITLNGSNDVTNDEEQEKTLELLKLNDDFLQNFANFGQNVGNLLLGIQRPIKSRERFTSRYETTETNIIIHECKILSCQILRDIINIRNNQRVSQFLYYFQRDDSKDGQSTDILGNVLNIIPFGIFDKQETDEERYEKKPIEWINNILSQNIIDIEANSKYNLVPVLLDLTLYENHELNNIAFEILNGMFSERTQLVELVKGVQLVEDESSIKLIKSIQKMVQDLQIHVEKSEEWMYIDTPSANQQSRQVLGILTKLYNLLQEDDLDSQPYNIVGAPLSPSHHSKDGGLSNPDELIDIEGEDIPIKQPDEQVNSPKANRKKQYSITDRGDVTRITASVKTGTGSLEENSLQNKNWNQLFEQGIKNNPVTQKLFRNLSVYQLIIDLISFDSANNASLRNTSSGKSPKSGKSNSDDTFQLNTEVLRLCYQILGRFVYEEKENKNVINPILISTILQHVDNFPDVYACCLLTPLSIDNKYILKNDKVFRQVIEKTSKCVNTQLKQKNFQLASSYFESLKFLTEYKSQIIKQNQTDIINVITHRDYDGIMHTLQDQNQATEFFRKVGEFSSKISSYTGTPIKVDSQIDYFNCFVYIMSIICDEKNNATESKAQGYFTLDHLGSLIDKSKDCFYVRRYLFFFFYHVYLDTEREMSDELMDIKKKAISQIQEDLIYISTNFVSDQIYLDNYMGITSLKDIKEDYYFNALYLCSETILQKSLIEEKEESEEFINQLLKSIKLMTEQEDQIQLENKVKLKKLIAQIIKYGFLTQQQVQQEIRLEWVPKNKYIRDISRLNQTSLMEQSLMRRQSKKKQSQFKQVSKAERLNTRIGHFEFKSEFIQECLSELKEFVDSFIHIKEKSDQAFNGICTIEFQELAQSLINFMLDKSDTTEELNIKRIKVLRQMIELENLNSTTPAVEWNSDDYDEFSHKIQKRQNSLVDYGVVKLIVELISDSDSSKEMIYELVLLSIALLLGGNRKVQDAFYEQFQEDPNNLYLVNLKEMITKSFSRIKKSMNTYNKVLFEHITNKEENQEDRKQKGVSINVDTLASDKDNDAENLDDEDKEIQKEEEDISNMELKIDEEDTEDLQFLQYIYRLLQLFCEGHNLQMQNYLREQKIGEEIVGRTHDFIFQAAINFSNVLKFINVHSVDLGGQLLDFLVESIQGPCPDNQINLTRAKVIDTSKDFINKFQKDIDYEQCGFVSEDEKQQINSLVTSSTTLLLSLIEGNANIEIFEQLSNNLDIPSLLIKLEKEYDAIKIKNNVKIDDIEVITEKIGSKFDDELMNSFNIYILLLKMAEKEEHIKDSLEQQPKKILKALEFFQYHTGSIEVMFQEQLVRVFFPIQPICRMISKNTRSKLMQEVPRETPNEKVEGLMHAATDLYDEMNHLSYLHGLAFNFSTKRYNVLSVCSLIIAFIINLTMLYSYGYELDEKTTGNTAKHGEDSNGIPFHIIIPIIGFVQLGTSSLMMIFWFIINGPLILKQQWRAEIEKNRAVLKDEVLNEEEDMDQDIDSLSSQEATRLLLYYGPSAKIFNKKEGKRNFGNGFTKMYYYWINIRCLLSQGNFRYMTFYIAVTIAGQFVSPVVFCFHLLDIINRFATLQNVIKAVTTNMKQLILTSVLGIVLLYIYAILAFYFVDDMYVFGSVSDYDGSSGQENQCTSLLQCFIVTINFGLIKGGGMGDVMSAPSYDDTYHDINRFYTRWVFDLSFFMLIKMAFLNIIFGVIIDTFAQLRDQKSQIDEDMKNICFICGLERSEFDRFADGFENHIERDHQLWYYVFYVYHIENMDHTDHNGIESFISSQYQGQEYDWFPLLKAMSIQHMDEEEEGEGGLEQTEEEIQKQINEIKEKIIQLNLQKSKVE